MSLDTALETMIKISGGVEMFHRLGYVHRDIKPSNIMLDSYGKPVLADFGVASKVGQLEVGAFDGFSVLWAPPEQQDVNSPASPLQDVWALAATTWTFVTGRSLSRIRSAITRPPPLRTACSADACVAWAARMLRRSWSACCAPR